MGGTARCERKNILRQPYRANYTVGKTHSKVLNFIKATFFHILMLIYFYSNNVDNQLQEQRVLEQATVFERRYHISADDENNGRGDSNNTSQVS